ncbi:MAG TPA: DUF1990 domain-containing protein [Candidatus Acidoferrum sp.]|nr:DUF1990 domain-containing protein [Candidatus Acidoferrum sp.]
MLCLLGLACSLGYVGCVLFLAKPGEAAIREALGRSQSMPFSYAHVGATRTTPPAGWRVHHMRAPLGTGRRTLEAAAAVLFSWKLLAVEGLEVFPSTETVQQGTNVAILSRHFGIWSLDFCRVIYVLKNQREHDGAVLRTGFGYGTLPGHAVRGEEIFSIEWRVRTEEVWYDIYSFSLPASPLVKLLSPVARAAQRRFARQSLEGAVRLAADAENRPPFHPP